MESKKTKSQVTSKGSLASRVSKREPAKKSETKTEKPSEASQLPLPPVEPPAKVESPGTKIRFTKLGGRNLRQPQQFIPGPKYDCDGLTRFGPVRQTGPVIIGRHPEPMKGHLTPGPGHYSPEKYDNPRYHNSPEARLLGRFAEDKSSWFTPGPGNYHVPSSIGDSHPTYENAQSARIVGRSWDKTNKNKQYYIPGPNQYEYDNNAYLRSGPSARILGRESLKGAAKSFGPGPGAYFADFIQGTSSPGFSFGRKHAPCVFVPLEDEGNRCIGKCSTVIS